MTVAHPDPGAAEKTQLRQRLRFRREHFTANLDVLARMAAFRSVPAPLAAALNGRAIIAGYAATGAEAGIAHLLGDLAATKIIALPFHGSRDAAMIFRRWQPAEPLVAGPWRALQPSDGAPAIAPDILLVPLIGFDRAGGRLGQGGGHYDRYFAAHPAALRIGIGWSVQEVDQLPVSAHDMPMDAILTEKEWILTGYRL